jgi:hypothetical protein
MSNKLRNEVKSNLTFNETDKEIRVSGVLAVDAFIIPNRAGVLKDYIIDTTREDVIHLCMDNNVNIDLCNDKIVETWMVSEECDNVERHLFMTDFEDKSYLIPYLGSSFDQVPAKFFEGKVEGDHVQLHVTRYNNRHSEKKPYKIDIIVDMCLNQTSYRYRDHGNFEDTLKAVCF